MVTAPTAIIDACVLYSAPIRDLVVRSRRLACFKPVGPMEMMRLKVTHPGAI